jgi:Tat protein translocase TatB subunit
MNIVGIGPGELVLILIIAVIVLGPDKIPETMRTIGKAMREIRTITEGFQKELNKELAEVTKEAPAQPAPAQPAPAATAPAATVAPAAAEAVSEQPIPTNVELPPPYGNGSVETPPVPFAPAIESAGAEASAPEEPAPKDGVNLASAALVERNPVEPAAPVTTDGHNGRNES